MGNILYRDEGVGVYAARYLQAAYRFRPEIEIADGAAMGFSIIDYFEDGTHLLVLDAVQTSAPAGTIYRLPPEELLQLGPAMQPTAHEVDPIQQLKLATAIGRAPHMVLLGIVPADASDLTVGLTAELQAAFPRFIEAALADLRGWGVEAELKRRPTLDEVIDSLVTTAR